MIRIECPCCGSEATTQLICEPYTSPALLAYMLDYYKQSEESTRTWLEGQSYEVLECTACGLCFQTFYPDNELAIAIYDRWIDQSRWREGDLRRASVSAYQPLLQEVIALAGYMERRQRVPLHELEILDYGMGWGSWLRIARAFGINAYGYELSPERIAHAASLGIPCLDDAALNGRKFHIINLEQVLEHVPDPRALVQKMMGLLHEGGLLKIGVPNGRRTASSLRSHGASRLLDPDFVAIRPLEHVNSFAPRTLHHLSGCLGLRVRRGPVLSQLSLICGASVRSLAHSIGRPLVRGVLGAGTSVVLSR